MATLTDNHICHVDCEPDGRGGHMMYPSDPTPHAGRYQNTLNLGMTRREYRASGQDESREVRLLTHNIKRSGAQPGRWWGLRAAYRRTGKVVLPF